MNKCASVYSLVVLTLNVLAWTWAFLTLVECMTTLQIYAFVGTVVLTVAGISPLTCALVDWNRRIVPVPVAAPERAAPHSVTEAESMSAAALEPS